MLPMPNLWTNMCVENWAVLPLSHASTLTTIRDPSCRRPSPTTVVQHEIHLTDDFKPRQTRAYRVPELLKAEMNKTDFKVA